MLDIKRYKSDYHQTDGKFVDNWASTLNLLPFNLNPSTSGFDKSCGFFGITGEFFRKWENVELSPIQNFEKDVEEPVKMYLHETGKMKQEELEEFIEVVKDILYSDGKMTLIDASFLPYLPLLTNYDSNTRIGKKYIDGQRKIADYLYSMLLDKNKSSRLKGEDNLFSKSIRNGMHSWQSSNFKEDDKYYILPFIKQLFQKDIEWLMGKEDYVIVRNINYLLHFYSCLSLSQTIAHLAFWRESKIEKPVGFYYMLTSEHASATRPVVEMGWEKWVSRDVLQKLSARAQALDIFNTLASDKPIGMFRQIVERLGADSFVENKDICEEVLRQYHSEKYDLLIKRSNITEDDLYKDFDYSISSYEEFYQKLNKLCMDFQSPEYKNRLEKKVRDLFEVKFLRNRRGLRVLVFDEDILVFLIAMLTKEQRTKLDDMYRSFNKYGIFFDINTRTAIETLLTKLNLLDRKSDSGEAQYVRVIL